MALQYEQIGDEYEFQDFLKDLFNYIYDTTTFEEYGSRGTAQYGVDIYSPVLKIAVQAKKKDVHRNQNKLKAELLSDLSETAAAIQKFPHPIDTVFLASTTPKYIEVQNAALTLTQSLGKTVRFYSWNDLQKEIAKYPQIRKKYYPHLSAHSVPKEIVSTPHIDVASVFGRNNDINRLNELLLQNSVVNILSMGGVGKTTFAKLFYQKNIEKYDHLIWLDNLSDYKNDWGRNESLADHLQIAADENDSEEKKYQRVLNRILALEGKVLIVIDNLQHEVVTSIETEIRKLLSNNQIKIVITSRQPFASFTYLMLESVDIGFAREIFHRNCPKEINCGRLDELLELISRNALLIELSAKTLYSALGLTIDKMIELLNGGYIETGLQIEVEQYSNGELLTGSLYGHLLRIVDIDKLEPVYERYIVILLSVLPANYIPIEEIFSVFLYRETGQHNVLNAINSLHKQGLLNRIGDQVKMHRMIQDVIKIELDTYIFYADILNSIARTMRKANHSLSNKGYRITLYAESILSRLVGEKAESILQPIILIKNNLYLMYRYLGEQDKANVLGKELADDQMLPIMLKSNSTQFAHTLNHNIGTYYFDIGDLVMAEAYFKKAIEANCGDLHIEVINSYNALYNIYYEQKRFRDALEYAGYGLEQYKKFPQDQHDDVWANLLNNFAIINSDMGNNNEAAFHITHAIKTYREYKGDRKNDGSLAAIYSNGALIFSRIENHEVAIQFVLHAIKYRANLQLERDETLLSYYELAVRVFERADNMEQANGLRELVLLYKNNCDK